MAPGKEYRKKKIGIWLDFFDRVSIKINKIRGRGKK
jgi:hypothetical protein